MSKSSQKTSTNIHHKAESSSEDEEILSESEEIIPREDQSRHISALLVILKRFRFALDNSFMGSGKTYTTIDIFKKLGIKRVIYVGVLTVLGEIRPTFEKFGVPTDNFITFQSLRSMKNKQPKHKLLTRHGDDTNEGEVYFRITPKMETYIREGVLLIADETQHVRNDYSFQCKALAELERGIIESNSNSMVLELTGLIGGKIENYINLMHRFRIIKNEQLAVFHKNNNRLELLGAQELVDFCLSIDPNQTQKTLEAHPFKKKTIINTCFQLYEDVVQNFITDSMPPAPSNASIDCKNGYYNISQADACHLNRAISNLERGSGYNSVTEDVNPKNKRWSLVTTSLRHIEISKINIFIAAAIRDLETHPTCKVCICLNYSDPVELVAAALTKYGALILWGKVDGNKRKPIMDKFNEANLDCRVLVANLKVINCGIRLDDRNGNFPRFVYGSSSFSFNEWHQFTRRFLRGRETQSNVRFRFIYGLISSLERPILRALSRHTEVCIKASKKQVKHGIKFPGEYEDEYDESLNCESYYDIGDVLRRLDKNRKKKYDESDSNTVAESPRIRVNVIARKPPVLKAEQEESSSSEEETEEKEVERPPRPPPIIQASPTPSRRRV